MAGKQKTLKVGLIGPFSAALNSVLGDHHRAPYAGALGLLDNAAIEEHASKLIKAYDVRPDSTSIPASSYSDLKRFFDEILAAEARAVAIHGGAS